ncbi:putative nuclear elongation and deformation protein [Phaeomoniella chlamydospora]|uniref:Putative nuclear elongation and deformation protein n=1 Tax=Phaeomoniella chlamydospora TaxID=158046 RepID=A0A0G2G5R8_PHACM|nr:putative nuclear elongation and deformation protein [Phaeomoniella chlamydospora]
MMALLLAHPSTMQVEFKVNGVKQNYAMKLGEGGEAFFVFETNESIPEAMQTSPLVSAASSPASMSAQSLPEPTYLDITSDGSKPKMADASLSNTVDPILTSDAASEYGSESTQPSTSWPGEKGGLHPLLERSASEEIFPVTSKDLDDYEAKNFMKDPSAIARSQDEEPDRPSSPPLLAPKDAYDRAISLSEKLSSSNIRSKVTEAGDLMLDMTGYKSSEDDGIRAEVIARKLLSDELEGNYDIGSLIGTDDRGNLWIYSSEEAKEAANRRNFQGLQANAILANDAVSDPGYHSDSDQSTIESGSHRGHHRSHSDVTADATPPPVEPTRNYAKTLRLTSDQLKALNLKPGANTMSFTVNKATCQAYMYLWSDKVPIVISDIDGTITKSDALGHVLNMIGRDWTHIGVAKLYTDIVANGYNILYLTSRSVGQADTTRAYLNGVNQEGYKLPKGPVIMSPDRTIAALRREIYLRKPEVFKMACLRDILSLFPGRTNPFYAGFGNRFTDALSYRTVNIPSSRIFTINSNAEVSLDLLNLNKYKTSYVNIREVVDHFFPPVSMLVKEGGEEFTDFNYWRDTPQGLDDFESTDSESGGDDEVEDEDEVDDEEGRELGESYLSRESFDESALEESLASLDLNAAETSVIDEEVDGDSIIDDSRTPLAEPDLERVLSHESIREVGEPLGAL